MAEEVSEMTKNNILMQSGIAVLGQANNTNQAALKLLNG
jgi:flagellin